MVDVVEVELVVDRQQRTVDVVHAEGDIVDVGTHHAGEVDDIVAEVLVEGGQHFAELLFRVLVVAAVFTVLGTFREEGVGTGVELLLLHFVGAVVLGAGAQGEPFEGLVAELGAAHQAVLVVLPLLVLGDPVGILHGVFEVVGPVLGLETAAGVVALIHLHLGPVVTGGEQIHGNDGVAVFALGDHVLLEHVAVGDVDIHGEDVFHQVRGVAEAQVVAVHVVIVHDTPGIGDGGRHIGLAAFRAGGQGQGVDLVHARLEVVARVVGGRGIQLGAPAVVRTQGRGTVGVLELGHDIGPGEGGAVGVVDVQVVFLAFLGGDDDDTVGGVGTIKGGGGRTGEDGDALDVVLVQGTQHVTGLAGAGIDPLGLRAPQGLHRDTVNHVQRVVVVGDGLGAAHHDTRTAAHTGGRLADGDTGHLTVEAVHERTHGGYAFEFGLLDVVGKGFLLFLDAHGGDHRSR